ncbi:hypothetical protein RRG08_060277 [Elysia crispata]|uniref:Uncharacterized protein n=1 Tax=Elysia crispata TaxID=231223 RepID=A0AAE1B7C6_9GAST|nr:hypothetical protein RRG08_060277 [Elysia crispata]
MTSSRHALRACLFGLTGQDVVGCLPRLSVHSLEPRLLFIVLKWPALLLDVAQVSRQSRILIIITVRSVSGEKVLHSRHSVFISHHPPKRGCCRLMTNYC